MCWVNLIHRIHLLLSLPLVDDMVFDFYHLIGVGVQIELDYYS